MNNKKNATILVVDDDAMVRSILVEYLNSFGYTSVIQVKNGREALKIIQNRQQKLDVVVSDWEMPDVDGLTLLKAVRNHPVRKVLKFIMVTSQISQERFKISKAVQMKVDAYIVKPFRGEILRQKLESLLDDSDHGSEAG